MNNYSDPREMTQGDLVDIAQKAQYLDGLPADKVRRLVAQGEVRWYPGQTLILEEGSEIKEVYLVLSGTLVVSLYQGIDPAFWLYMARSGALVDTSALLEPPVSPVSVRALSDVEVLAIPRAAFVDLTLEEPQLGYEILQDLCSRLVIVNQAVLKQFSQPYAGPSPN